MFDFGLAIACPVAPVNWEKGLAMHSVAWWPTMTVLAVATFTDLRSRRIPNWLVLPFMAAGMVVSCVTQGRHGFYFSILGLLLGAGVYGLLHFMGGMGMGDVKLVAAIGTWIGPSQLLFAMLVTGVAGGLMAVGWAVCGGFLGDLFRGTGDIFVHLGKRGLQPHPEIQLSSAGRHKLPYAPAIAVGTLISFFSI